MAKKRTYKGDRTPDEGVSPPSSDSAASDKEILEEGRKRLSDCISNEKIERAKMADDLRFATLDQWPASLRKSRENDPNGAKPCLTSDRINQYIVQVVNDARQNRPAIKARPVDDKADIATAKVYQGLFRHIEDRSNASIAYETGIESTARMGLGYWRVITDYVKDESFDQEISIKRIPDAFAVYLGPHIEPDGSDAEYGFVIEDVPLDQFKREHPKAKVGAESFADLGDTPSWRTDKTIKRVEYFYTQFTRKDLLFLADGKTAYSEDFKGKDSEITDRRSTFKREIKWCRLTGAEILDKRDWAGKYIPIVEVIGKESWVDGKRILWGLVRPAKDDLRMNNYWLSAATERIALSPKAPFIAAEGQVEGRESEWKNANKESRAVLQYKAVTDGAGNALPRPSRVEPPPVETAMIGMMQLIEGNVRSSLGMYKASVGDTQGQQSGRAILALQRESDTGTFHFSDNLSRSIAYCGRILVDLIPKIYDTKRILRIIGEDGEVSSVEHNPEQPQAMREIADAAGKVRRIYNLGVGEYDVTVTVGPSYNTKRMEAATTFAELSKGAGDPASAAVMRYLTVKNSDFTSSDEAIAALKALLPPPVLQAITTADEPIPPKAMAAIAQLHQQTQVMGQKLQEVGQENVKLKSGEASKMAAVSVDAQHGQAQQEIEKKRQADAHALALAKAMDELALKEQIAKREAEIADRVALAEHNRKVQELADQRALDTDRLNHEKMMREEQMRMDHEMKTNKQAEAQAEGRAEGGEIAASLKGVFGNLEKTLQEMTKALINPPPREVSIGNVRKDANGQITGARVSAKPGRMIQ